MTSIRPARLEDCERVASLAQAQVTIWQRWDADRRVEDVSYSSLTIYQRWLHGGAWMSIETAAIHLGRLLLGAGIALVAEQDDALVGYAEAYHGVETEPFGAHLHLGALFVSDDVAEQAVDEALLDALRGQAKALKCARMTTVAASGETALRLFERARAQPLAENARYSLPARQGQGLYQALADSTSDARQLAGWSMPVGRATSARQQWEMLWQPTWDALPELRERTYRLKFAASGQEAYVVFQRGLHNLRCLDVYCWSPRTVGAALLMALRDWAYREGYRSLALLVAQDSVKSLGTDAEADGNLQVVWGLGV